MRCTALAVSALTLGAVTLLWAAPAGAAQTGVVVAAAGSDTSEGMMTQFMNFLHGSNIQLTIGGTANTPVDFYNIPASPGAYSALSGGKFVVPGESATATDCPSDVTWTVDPAAPGGNTALSTGQKGTGPFGSGAGRNYLATEDSGTGPAGNGLNGNGGAETAGHGFGCVDIARSSGAPRAAGGGDKSTFEYYAYAFDALSWATTSTHAPAVLTHQQIKDIYLCNVTNWNQVGGTDGPIVRYLPQAGSGTRSFFISDVLGGHTPDNVDDNTSNDHCGTAITNGAKPLQLVEENQAKTVAGADVDAAILPFSAALWNYYTFNEINGSIDKRCPPHGTCAKLGAITTTGGNVTASPTLWVPGDHAYELNTGGVVTDANVKQFSGSAWNEATGSFVGIRYIYNVLDNVANTRGYQAAWQEFGFDNTSNTGSKGQLCDSSTGFGGTAGALMVSDGFAPLPALANSNSNKPGSNCRFFAGVN